MKQPIYWDALLRIRKEEDKLSLESTHSIEDALQMTIFLRDLLAEIKTQILEFGFANDMEEIGFFRKIKPQILGKLIYYNKVYRIETSCPVKNGKMYYSFFSEELRELKQEYKAHICYSDFFRYYRSGRTDHDHEYFKLGRINIHSGLNSYIFEIDTQFSTYYDYKVSRIIANDLLHSYLISKITPEESDMAFDASPHSKDLFWTDSKNALIELIYALYASGCISNGKIGIRQLNLVFQILFRTQLGDVHHAFHRMKSRVGNRTIFLDQLKSSLEQYMDKNL